MNSKAVKKIISAPSAPGVYIFYKAKSPIYIGKASNLKNRLKNYLKITDSKTEILHQEASGIKYVELSSPIEALIKESQLIKILKPQFNICWRDDKNYFYVVFTKEKFPKVLFTHQPGQKTAIGPFTDGKALRLVLRILRRRYPYCTCLKPHLRLCLNAQIENCLGFCCKKDEVLTKNQQEEYHFNIKTIQAVLNGKKRKILQRITTSSDSWAIENIFNHSQYLEKPEKYGFGWKRIEGYDVSNFAGREAVGAMTVLTNKAGDWQPDKSQFRKFKIKSAPTKDDPRMIAEVIRRRLNHPEWPYPDLIVVDGGLTQYNAAQKVLGQFSQIKLCSFAKPKKIIYGHQIKNDLAESIINQTHRYVISYHRRLRDKKYLA